jgi:hypothetical protein
MKVQLVAAAALALACLGGCSDNSQMTSACTPDVVGDVSPGVDVGTHCNPTSSNPMTALRSAITGGPSRAPASAPATQPSG